MKYLWIILIGLTTVVGRADYVAVLATYVDAEGMLNYKALANDRKPLDEYIQSLKRPDTAGWSEQDWVAFWINAYNARTLQVIIDHYPTEGIRKISGAWTKLKFPILGKERTLDEIEHKILRREYEEPRIHVALVCAAYSCPKLRNEPYVGTRLEEPLADQSRDFLSLPSRFKVEGNTAYISQIFKFPKRTSNRFPVLFSSIQGRIFQI